MSAELIDEPFVISRDGLRRLGIDFTNQHLLRLEAAGRFPRRASLGHRRVVWVYSEILAWISDRLKQREAAAAERRCAAMHCVEVRKTGATATARQTTSRHP